MDSPITLDTLIKMATTTPISSRPSTPTFGPFPGPPVRTPPQGPDPYVEDRERVRNDARQGKPCPTNMHGCTYFSASEWRFCPMCEWLIGHAAGVKDGLLAPSGSLIAQHKAEVEAGSVINVTSADFDAIVSELRKMRYAGLINHFTWQMLEQDTKNPKLCLTRRQLTNLLLNYNVNQGDITDEVWADFQKRFP